MAINTLQGMSAFFGELTTPALPFNCLVQLRIPGLDNTGEPSGPDFTPRKITNFSDVVKTYNPGFTINLIDLDGKQVPHRLTYQDQNTVEEFFNKQFNPAYLVKNLQKACDGTETRSLLWEDLVRNAALLRAITHWGPTGDDVIAWLQKIPFCKFSRDRHGEPHRTSRRRYLQCLNHRCNGFMDDTEKSVPSASSVVICDSDDGRGRLRVPGFDHGKIYTRNYCLS